LYKFILFLVLVWHKQRFKMIFTSVIDNYVTE